MEGKKARQGSATRQATRQLPSVRLTPEKHEQALLMLDGRTWAGFVKEKLLGEKPPPRAAHRPSFDPDYALLAEVRLDCKRGLNNLNQLVHLVHLGDLEQPRGLEETLLAVQRTHDRATELMGLRP